MKASNFRPIMDRVLIKQDDELETTKGGIVIPEKHRENRELINTGVIIAIGPGKKSHKGVFIETTLVPGQRVVWRRHGGIKIQALEDHVITTEDELLGVIDTRPF